MAPNTTLTIRPSSGALGAEIEGVDLGELTDELFEQIKEWLLQYLVVFFPGQHDLTPEAHIELGRRFGELEDHPFLPKVEGHPELIVLSSDHGTKADEWHIDVAYQPNPPIASILRLVTCPPSGGDTMWSNLCLAYERLSAPMRDLLDGLTGVQILDPPSSSTITTKNFSAEHPIVRVHPETGRRSLYVSRMWTSHIPQLSRPESDALLQMLFEHTESPQFVCRHRWAPGTVAIWDNRATQHFAINDYTEYRMGQRVTVLGDCPQPAADITRWPHFTAYHDERYWPRRAVARRDYDGAKR